ncbi:hypothetical protein HA402_002105 [Bradysia odoriphaga]|nr:hypothetical protein HA402_002105 [Bradysia odoriphaga]
MSMLKSLFTKYPLVRGMVSYSLIWPTSALIQQTIAGKTWGKSGLFLCAAGSTNKVDGYWINKRYDDGYLVM